MRFLYRPKHPKANERGFVSAADLGDYEDKLATNASILVGRFYENTKATDGTDIGSRKKHREWKKQHGYADFDDYSDKWRADRAAEKDRAEDKSLRETVGRTLYQLEKRR